MKNKKQDVQRSVIMPLLLDKITFSRERNVIVIGQNDTMKTEQVMQNIEDLKKTYPSHQSSDNHMYKTNNWLKMHGETMRRKPFKRLYLFIGEMYKLRH